MRNFGKGLFIVGFLMFMVPSVFQNTANADYTKTFRISAYYSPLPCQNRYVTGSYEGDIRLNGRGTNGADGTQVYPGMIAAPKTFAFGSKLYIPGFGTGTVHDRGGAIVAYDSNSGLYDRLDIWMGYGDVGLNRALNWGKKNLDVEVYGVNPDILDNVTIPGFSWDEKTPACDNVSVPEINKVIKSEPVIVPEKDLFKEFGITADNLFYSGLMKGDNNNEVFRLQKELANLNFYKAKLNTVFDDKTMHALFKFQQSQGLIAEWSDVGAGYFGPKTRARLNEIVSSRNENNLIIAQKNHNISLIASN